MKCLDERDGSTMTQEEWEVCAHTCCTSFLMRLILALHAIPHVTRIAAGLNAVCM
jgi:hypothetical protein